MGNLNIIILALVAGFATYIGVLLGIKVNKSWGHAFGVSFAAAIMLLITFFELIPEGIKTVGFGKGILYIILGGLLIFAINFYIPHLHAMKDEKNSEIKDLIRISYLVLIGLIMHEFPEGFAMANSFKLANDLGIMVFLSIFLHNIPEGYALSVAAYGLKRVAFYHLSALYSVFSIVLGSIFGILILEYYTNSEGYLILVAAGIMSFISIHELYPLAKRSNNIRLTVFGTISAVIIFLFLDLITGA